MIDWSPLRAELKTWSTENRTLPFWWRDDDAIAPTLELNRLTSLANEYSIPVHLAVIPASACSTLGPYLSEGPLRAVVHGWAHKNTAPNTEKNSEFGYPRADTVDQAKQGLDHLRQLFHTDVYAMFVPPWNRIAPSIIEGLSGAGFTYLSTFTPRQATFAAANLMQINTHVDPVDWRGTRGLAEPDNLIQNIVVQLQDRRNGRVDADEPLGLLTHHLMQDDETWAFCDALLQELQAIRLDLYDISHAPNCGGRRR